VYVSAYSFTSPPVQNALSPAPVRTITATPSSNVASLNAACISWRVRVEYALYTAGRLIVTVATQSFLWYRMSLKRNEDAAFPDRTAMAGRIEGVAI